MKTKTISLLLAAALLLSGCSNSPETAESVSIETPTAAVSEIAETAVKTEETAVRTTEFNEGPDTEIISDFVSPIGDEPDFSNAVVFTADGRIDISEMTDDNWLYAVLNGYAYMAEPDGISLENNSTPPEKINHTYKKYAVGDKVCGMKISEASTIYSGDCGHLPCPYFEGCDVFFEGETTLKGMMRIIAETDSDSNECKGDIQFVPDSKSELPIMGFSLFDNSGDSIFKYSDGTNVFYSEYSIVSLGNVSSYNSIDFSLLPADGKFAAVEIKISDVRIHNEINLAGGTNAVLKELKI